MRHYKVRLLTATACVALWCSAALGQNAPSQNGTVQNGTVQKAPVPNASVQKAGPGSINGPWTVTFTIQVSEKQAQTVSGEMTFQADGEKLGGSVETEHTGHGTLNGGAWSHNKLSGIYVFESHEAIAIAGEFREGKLAGVFRTEGRDGKWEAVPAGVQP